MVTLNQYFLVITGLGKKGMNQTSYRTFGTGYVTLADQLPGINQCLKYLGSARSPALKNTGWCSDPGKTMKYAWDEKRWASMWEKLGWQDHLSSERSYSRYKSYLLWTDDGSVCIDTCMYPYLFSRCKMIHCILLGIFSIGVSWLKVTGGFCQQNWKTRYSWKENWTIITG